MSTFKIAAAAAILLGAYALEASLTNREKAHELKIAFAGYWKSIHPGLQHTLVGDLTLSNQFEALVGFNENGVYVPLASKEWSVSQDYRIFRFTIDTARRFSDGVYLSANHFKTSWEDALRLEPKSSNSSLLDILYKVEGFGDFARTGTLSGLRVIDDATFEVRFSTPFRMALEQLSGNRFASYREVNGKFLGTGAYVIEELGPDLLHLRPNGYFSPAPKSDILLSTVTATDAVHDLSEGKIDVVAYAMGATISPDLASKSKISTIVGQDALHRALYTNNRPGRFFEKREFRLALQFLVHEYLKSHPAILGNPTYTTIDAQVYLPIQAGRLDESEVNAIIESGKQYVPALLEAAKKSPPVLLESAEFSMRALFTEIGLDLSSKSRIVDKPELIDIIYKGEAADIIPGSFGVASGDPDGIYHKLGKSGAIASPMTFNAPVSDMLEQGRKLTDKAHLDEFYKRVNKTILEEAPLIHMGFNKAIALYRNDKIKVSGRILRRNEGHLQIFEER